MRPVRSLLPLLALALIAAACGGGTSDSAAGTATDPAVSPPPATEVAEGTRTVVHDMGETEVPAEPERVVVLDSPHLGTALSLGVQPVGAVAVFADQGLPAYLGDRTAGIEVVGTIEEPDLEAIAALEPD